MKKTGFIFPGQGSQKVGMLSELSQSFPVIKATFQEASEVLDMDLWEIAQSDQRGVLSSTEITQPVLLSASISIWRVWLSLSELKPTALSGHSLGEYSALVCSGALSFKDALDLVHFRGRAMQKAVPNGEGKMAAILGLSERDVSTICDAVQKETGVVSAANVNSANQIVIAGESKAVTSAIESCKAAGAKRALALGVSVPSHCELMVPAARELEEKLSKIHIQTPEIDVIQNVDGEVQDEPDAIKTNLVEQLYRPVRWVDCVNKLHQLGCRYTVECGSGKVLSGLVKRIQPELKCLLTDTDEELKKSVQELSE